MNGIEPLYSNEMSSSSSAPVAFTFFLSSCITGWYIYYLYTKSEVTEKRLTATVEKVKEILDVQDVQSESIDEFNTRVCEKKDYDDSEEIEECKYQAWKGAYTSDLLQLTVVITREKESTFKKNQEWTAWDGSNDGSSTVRDFYLGNSHPDFSWDIRSNEGLMYEASVSDTLINGWDSVIKLSLTLVSTQGNLLAFTASPYYNGSPTLNAALKKILDTSCIDWSRVLVDA